VRIGLNLLYLIPGEVGGTQTYAERLIEAIAVEGPQHEYVLFVNSKGALLQWPALRNFRVVVSNFPARSRAARYAHEQFALPRRLRAEQIDLVHSLGYVGPLRAPCGSVISVHDAVSEGYPMSAGRRAVLAFFVGRSARGCDHVITVSEFSRREITRHYGVSESRITVTHEGPRDLPELPKIAWPELQRRYQLSKPYIVAISSTLAHKNIARLVEAFGALSADIPHKLVLIGRLPQDGHVEREIERRRLGDRVIVTGYIPDDHLMPLLADGDTFVFPSWYEGFGLPVLDAQMAGLPLACSNAASLPEIAGDGAEFFDPRSVDDMARAIRICVTPGTVRDQMIARGHKNIHRFSWNETARKTLRVYEEVAVRRGFGAGDGLGGRT
jgi:glycosyltransferase involved in cell wall biosynthesis